MDENQQHTPAPGEGEESTGVSQEETRRAMATYASDGQGDDSTGGDALAEVWRERQGTTGRAE